MQPIVIYPSSKPLVALACLDALLNGVEVEDERERREQNAGQEGRNFWLYSWVTRMLPDHQYAYE